MNVEIKKRKTYIVKEGETIQELVNILNCEKQSIIAINKIEEVEEGDEIIIPNHQNRNYYIVKPADNLETISKKMGISKEEILKKYGKAFFIGQKIYF